MYIISKKQIELLQIQIKKKKMAKILKLAIKNIYPNYQTLYTTSIQVLIPDLVFPVYKIDREQSGKNVSKVRLKIPKRYSEAVVLRTF